MYGLLLHFPQMTLSVIKCILYKVYTINAPFYRKCSCCISVLSR